MLLRESSKAVGGDAGLDATVGRGGDGGVPHGEAIVRFGEAVTKGTDEVANARASLIAAVGPEGFAEACAIVGIFNGLVRTADASGIPLDDGTLAASKDFRAELGLEDYPSAVNTPLESGGDFAVGESDVAKLFG
jgi:hypothetical protein